MCATTCTEFGGKNLISIKPRPWEPRRKDHQKSGKKSSGPFAGARGEEEEFGPAVVKSLSPGGKAFSTKIRCSDGTQL
jgi:hypothetical protein